jgi:cytochrome c-type biogenesis protein CcmH/NrfG
LAGLVALAVHGLVDFNLRIPSNAILFLTLAAVAAAPLGTVVWARGHRWAFVAALVAIAGVYARAADPWPLLRGARASALKVGATSGASLRLSVADRQVRTYLDARPGDPEAWLLAAWMAARAGRPADAAMLAHHAIGLDPSSPALLVAAQTLTDGLPGQ